MARPIDADEFMKRLILDTSKGCYGEHMDGSDTAYTFKEIDRFVDEMPTLTPPNEWVSVEDKLPENNTQVLMWSARWKIAEAGSYYNQHFWVYSEIGDGYIADNITHWMPLPRSPE